jgi:hypothetical protein
VEETRLYPELDAGVREWTVALQIGCHPEQAFFAQ